MIYKFWDLADKFVKLGIVFTYSDNYRTDRFAPDDEIEVAPNSIIEPYCGFLNGNMIYSMGSFSYSWSQLYNCTVGRYSSIANGVSFLGFRHPYECLTSSSIVYDSYFSIMNLPFRKDGFDNSGSLFVIVITYLSFFLWRHERPRYYSRPRDWGAFPKKLPAALWGPKSSNVYTKYP